MIKILEHPAANVVAVSASGRVDSTDYQKTLVPAVNAALAAHAKVRLLYQLGDDFEGFTGGAMWNDLKLGLGHLAAWEKIAVVTDRTWIADAANLFRFAIPCPVRVFSNKDMSAAESWIAA